MTYEGQYLTDFLQQFKTHAEFCRQCLTIRDKRGVPVPMALGPAQRRLSEKIRELRAAGRPVRIVYLKARQVWVSTGFAAEVMHEVPFAPGQRALVVAHDEDSATNIFGYYKQFHQSFKPFGIVRRPEQARFSEEGLIEYANGSRIEVATAGTTTAGRSKSLRFLHLSEFAFWPNPKVLMDGLMQAVPDDPDTMVVAESTANGMGGEFYQLWQRAIDPAVETEWVPLFFAWWEHPEYTRDLECSRREFQDSLDAEEQTLMRVHQVSFEQLAWRRWKIANDLGGSVESFHQEFPSTPDEAFIASGRPRFSQPHLSRMPVRDGMRCHLELDEDSGRETVAVIPDEHGILTVFARPAERHRYSIGVDVCEGVDVNAIAGRSQIGGENPDFSVSSVLDIATGEQVALMRWRLQPSAWARVTYLLGRWYHWAYITPEANGPGIAFLEELMRLRYPPGKIYHREPDPSERYSTEASNTLDKLGWKTTTVTRPQLISKLDRVIREPSLYIYDAVTLSECRSFVIKASGKAEHAAGCHDDTVIATALALVGLEAAPQSADIRAQRKSVEQLAGLGGVRRYGQRRSEERGALIRL